MSELLPLDRYLAKRALVPMWPPGQQFLYTNAAYDLLGLVIQGVSGVPFVDHMDQHILHPLEMDSSTFQQPSPLRPDLALTYHHTAGQQTIVPDGLLLNLPAAGLSATAADMAHFMIAQLQDGRYGDHQILPPPTVRDMHQPHFTYELGQPGMAYGFRWALSPRTQNGPRDTPPSGTPVLWHQGGGPRQSTSYLQLRPQDGFGLFLAFNSDEFHFLDQVLSEFNDHFDPVVSDASQTTPQPTTTDATSDLTRFTGVYRPVDYSHNTLSKLLLLQAEDLPQVVVTGNTLGIRWLPDAPAQPDPLIQVEPLVFTSQDGRFRFTFLADQSGQVTRMDWGNLFVLEKVPWYQTVGFQRGLFATFLVVFLLGAVVRPASTLAGRIRRPPARIHGSIIGVLASVAAGLTAGLNAVLLLSLLLVLPRALDLDLQFGMPPMLMALLAVPMLTTALAVGLVLLAIPVWRLHSLSRFARVVYSFVTVVALAFVPFLMYWNLLGFRW